MNGNFTKPPDYLGFRVADIRVSENVGNAVLIVEVTTPSYHITAIQHIRRDC